MSCFGDGKNKKKNNDSEEEEETSGDNFENFSSSGSTSNDDEVGKNVTFVHVYDGDDGGLNCPKYIKIHLFSHLMSPSDKKISNMNVGGLQSRNFNQCYSRLCSTMSKFFLQKGIAKRLIQKVKRVARKIDVTFAELKSKNEGERRESHNGKTQVIISIDQKLTQELDQVEITVKIPVGLLAGYSDTTSVSRIEVLVDQPKLVVPRPLKAHAKSRDTYNALEEETSLDDYVNFGSLLKDEFSIWSRDLERHYYGHYSYAIIEANVPNEDYSQVKVDDDVTFVGVYDGHGGPNCAQYIKDRFPTILKDSVVRRYTMFNEDMRDAYAEIEGEFKYHMFGSSIEKPEILRTGSCCLIGIISMGTIYVANVGNSRAIIAYSDADNNIKVEQISEEHDVNLINIRKQVWEMNEDLEVLINENGFWSVKGCGLQVSRSIGDYFLKDPNIPVPKGVRYIGEPIKSAALRADPTVYSRLLTPNDKFLIFASAGFWAFVSSDEAVTIVDANPHKGIAKRLIHKALRRAARTSGLTFAELKSKKAGERRDYYDDITVVVIFLDDMS